MPSRTQVEMAPTLSAKRRRLSPSEDPRQSSKRAFKQFYNNAAEWDLEQEYERRPRKTNKKDKEQTRLPIKTTDGGIATVEEPDRPEEASDSFFESGDEVPDDDEDAQTAPEEPEKPAVPLKVQVLQTKEELARIAALINEDPEEHIGSFKGMLEMITASTPPAVKKLALAAMAAVYKDVIPGYRIRALGDADKMAKVSKDVRKLRDFEQSLLSGYQNYVQQLSLLTKPKQAGPDGLKSVSVGCACSLLLAVPHFNCRAELLKNVVRQLAKRQPSKEFVKARETIEEVFRNDDDGVVSMEAVSMMSKMMKARDFNIHESVLDTFLHLRLLSELSAKGSRDRVDKAEEAPAGGKTPKQKKEFRTKKERKLLREQNAVAKDMKEADALASHEQRDKMQSETLKSVFGVYFRILKLRSPHLIGAVLEGLAKYAHLINQDFFGDLLEVLRELTDQADPYADRGDGTEDSEGEAEAAAAAARPMRDASREALLCCTTAFALLDGQDVSKAASALHLDLSYFTTHIYKRLYSLALDPDIEFNPYSSLRLPDPGTDTGRRHADEDKNDDNGSSDPQKQEQQKTKNKVNFQTPAVLLLRSLHAILTAKGLNVPPPIRCAAFTKRLLTSSLHLPEKSVLATLALLARVARLHARTLAPLWHTDERRGDGVFDGAAATVEGSNVFASSVWEGELLRMHYCPQVQDAARELEKIIAAVK